MSCAKLEAAAEADAERFLRSVLQTQRKRRRRSPVPRVPMRRFLAFDPWCGDGLKLLSNAPEGKGQEVLLDGIPFITEEHAIQFHKFRAAAAAASVAGRKKREHDLLFYSEIFKGTSTPLLTVEQAKKVGEAMRLAPDELEAYYDGSMALQTKICMFKYTQDARIRNVLQATGDAELVNLYHHRRSTDTVWGAIVDDSGKLVGRNELGRIWMRIRSIMS